MKRISASILLTALALSPALAQSKAPAIPKPKPLDAKTSPLSAAQKSAMFGIAHPTAGLFSIDREPVNSAQFTEFLNSLGVKTLGRDEPGGNVGPDNIPKPQHSLFLKFPEKPAPQLLIGLDSEDSTIGTANGGFAANAGDEKKPVVEVSLAGARAYCAWRGERLPKAAELQAVARQFKTPEGLLEWSADRGARDAKSAAVSAATGHANVGFRCAGD